MYVYMYVCVYVYMYVFMYVCMYVFILMCMCTASMFRVSITQDSTSNNLEDMGGIIITVTLSRDDPMPINLDKTITVSLAIMNGTAGILAGCVESAYILYMHT